MKNIFLLIILFLNSAYAQTLNKQLFTINNSTCYIDSFNTQTSRLSDNRGSANYNRTFSKTTLFIPIFNEPNVLKIIETLQSNFLTGRIQDFNIYTLSNNMVLLNEWKGQIGKVDEIKILNINGANPLKPQLKIILSSNPVEIIANPSIKLTLPNEPKNNFSNFIRTNFICKELLSTSVFVNSAFNLFDKTYLQNHRNFYNRIDVIVNEQEAPVWNSPRNLNNGKIFPKAILELYDGANNHFANISIENFMLENSSTYTYNNINGYKIQLVSQSTLFKILKK